MNLKETAPESVITCVRVERLKQVILFSCSSVSSSRSPFLFGLRRRSYRSLAIRVHEEKNRRYTLTETKNDRKSVKVFGSFASVRFATCTRSISNFLGLKTGFSYRKTSSKKNKLSKLTDSPELRSTSSPCSTLLRGSSAVGYQKITSLM